MDLIYQKFQIEEEDLFKALHSEEAEHCQEIKPLMQELENLVNETIAH